jgi:FAD/FMN-containing dehydrogenase
MGVTIATAWQPADAAEVLEIVGDARRDGRELEVRGGGSILDRLPPGDEVALSTERLSGIVDHAPADLTVTVRAGTRVDELAATLAEHGQECPIEPIGPDGSTVGGRLATALAGPRQLGAGRVRDQVLRVRFVTGGGLAATAGGVTVKDVTGFDLCRLLTGSWGTIGVITEATLKLRPLPEHSAWYVTAMPRPEVVDRLHRPAAVVTTQTATHVLLEEHPDDAAAQAAGAGLVAGEAPQLPSTARSAVDPGRLAGFLRQLDGDLTIATHHHLGLCHLDGPVEALAAARAAAEHHGGSLLVLDPGVGLPAFGPAQAPTPLAARVGAALDPHDVLAPWRWHR